MEQASKVTRDRAPDVASTWSARAIHAFRIGGQVPMGQWTITIHGHGGHDNNSETDIERLLARFLFGLRAAGQDIEVSTSLTIGSRREVSADAGPTTPPPPPPPEDPKLPPPQQSGPYRVVHRGSGVPGADELTDQAKYPFKAGSGDTVWKAVNPRGQVSWYVAEANDPKPSVDGFTLAFTL